MGCWPSLLGRTCRQAGSRERCGGLTGCAAALMQEHEDASSELQKCGTHAYGWLIPYALLVPSCDFCRCLQRHPAQHLTQARSDAVMC